MAAQGNGIRPAVTDFADTDLASWRDFLPWDKIIVVADTNALARACVAFIRNSQPPTAATILGSHRAKVLVGCHVPTEIHRAIGRITRSEEEFAQAVEVWHSQLSPGITVVDLPIGEYLRPEIAVLRHGFTTTAPDVDDLPTAALAAFLAPAVIWTSDDIFVRTGLAQPVEQTADNLKALTVAESATSDALMTTFTISRALGTGAVALAKAASRQPLIAGLLLLLAGAAYAAVSHDPRRALKVAHGKTVLRAVGSAAGHLGNTVLDLDSYRQIARNGLKPCMTPPWRLQSTLEVCAVTLARSKGSMTATALLDAAREHELADMPSTVGELKRLLEQHPAFRLARPHHWVIGRMISKDVGDRSSICCPDAFPAVRD